MDWNGDVVYRGHRYKTEFEADETAWEVLETRFGWCKDATYSVFKIGE